MCRQREQDTDEGYRQQAVRRRAVYRMPEEYRASRKEWSVTSNAQKDREMRPPVLPILGLLTFF